MSKYGYLKCKCSDPGSDYIESHEILDVDDTGFVVGIRRATKYFYNGNISTDGIEEKMVNEEKEWYDKNRPDLEYPNWLDHEKYFKVRENEDPPRVILYSKERINVPLDYVKEHSNDNSGNGLYIKDFWSSNMTDTDKAFHGVLSDWTHNVYWGEEPTNCVTHTWSLD